MIRFITVLLFLLLSMDTFSQSFDIPTAREKKGKSTGTLVPGPQVPTKTKPNSRITEEIQIKTVPPPPDPTTGTNVRGIERNPSIAELENQANQGDIKAHTELGMYYFMQDDARALPHLIAGVEAGDSRAQYFLGGVYYFGKFGKEVDKITAASYYLKSAQQGHVPAQYGIAVCLYNGEGVEQDRQAARAWMEIAAKNNSEEAKAFLETHTFE